MIPITFPMIPTMNTDIHNPLLFLARLTQPKATRVAAPPTRPTPPRKHRLGAALGWFGVGRSRWATARFLFCLIFGHY
jgi:hypothetical protein